MKVALVKVKVKSSAAFRGIVANKNNISVSCGSCVLGAGLNESTSEVEKKENICNISIFFEKGWARMIGNLLSRYIHLKNIYVREL